MKDWNDSNIVLPDSGGEYPIMLKNGSIQMATFLKGKFHNKFGNVIDDLWWIKLPPMPNNGNK